VRCHGNLRCVHIRDLTGTNAMFKLQSVNLKGWFINSYNCMCVVHSGFVLNYCLTNQTNVVMSGMCLIIMHARTCINLVHINSLKWHLY